MGALEESFRFVRGQNNFKRRCFDGTKIFIGGGLTRNHSETNYDCYVIDVAPCKTMQLPTVLSHYSGVLSGFLLTWACVIGCWIPQEIGL